MSTQIAATTGMQKKEDKRRELEEKICLLRQHYPEIPAVEIARRAGCIRTYVGRVLKRAGLSVAARCKWCGRNFWRRERSCIICRPKKQKLVRQKTSILTCKNCRKKFSRSVARIQAAKRRGFRNHFCSRFCAYAWRGRRIGCGIRLRCDNCGQPFQRPPSVQKRRLKRGSAHTYCSNTCAAKGRVREFWKKRSVPLPAWLQES